MNYRDLAKAQLRTDEGLRTKPYRDSVGKLTIGYGRNLDDVGLSHAEAEQLLANDIDKAEADCLRMFANFDALSEGRRAVLVNMMFNLGAPKLAKFKRFRAAVESGDFEKAAAEMLASLWCSQVGERARRLAKQMKAGG